MREIKFRAWDKKNKKMIYDVQRGAIGGTIVFYPLYFSDFLKEKKFILMQYTELKDENSKKIYEGDVIGINKIARPDFIWLDKPFVVKIPDIYFLFERHVLGNEVKIIGNICENPKLIKENG